MPQSANPIPQLEPLAAELYADYLGKGRVVLHLQLFYQDIPGTFPAKQFVAIYEEQVATQKGIYQLQQDTTFSQISVPISCATSKENNLKIVKYKTTLDLGEMHAQYQVTWGYCGLQGEMKNMEEVGRKYFALVLKLGDVWSEATNFMPYLTSVDMFKVCSNHTIVSKILATDKDRDSVKYQLALLQSGVAVNGDYSGHPHDTVANIKSISNDQSFIGNYLTGNPPLTGVKLADSYTSTSPLGNQLFKLNQKTGVIEIKSTKTGRYVVAVSVHEERNNIKISEHPCWILLDVL